MKKKQVHVIDEEAMPQPSIIASFSSIQQAENYIASLEVAQKAKVLRGGFGIDAPEKMLK